MKRLVPIVLLAACSLERMQQQPRCDVDGRLGDIACNMPAPDGVVAWNDKAPAPPPLTRALLVRGRDRYERLCAACHGVAGDGDSAVNEFATPRVPSLLAPEVVALSDTQVLESLARVLHRPPLAPDDRWAVLHYVRVLQHRDAPIAEVHGEVPWR